MEVSTRVRTSNPAAQSYLKCSVCSKSLIPRADLEPWQLACFNTIMKITPRYCSLSCCQKVIFGDQDKQRKLEESQKKAKAEADKFYFSKEWRELRYQTLVRYGSKCMLCNKKSEKLHVDHIKPRSKFPYLALDPNNLQVLCEDCNLGKSNKFEHDFRHKSSNEFIF